MPRRFSRGAEMKPLCVVATFLSVLLASISAHAKGPQTNVQALYDMCKSSYWQQTSCLPYIEGVADTLVELGSISHGFPEPTRGVLASLGMCPGDATYGAAKQVFINWAEKHPDQWAHVASDGVFAALSQTWPCPK